MNHRLVEQAGIDMFQLPSRRGWPETGEGLAEVTWMWWTVLAAFTLVLVTWTCLRITIGNRRLGKLRDQDPAGIDRWPSVSVVVAARNEEENLQEALESLLRMDYDNYEVIVVDDRSVDRTADILEECSAEHSRLTVLHVGQLPAGWLGKNHAQWRGAQVAKAEYVLFTDADVTMNPETLRRAMAYVVRQRVDHLTMTPDAVMPSLILQAFVVLFLNLFALFTRPWNVANPKSSAFIGIGAFNLVRADVYQAVGTHEAIAMRPDDDVKLGKIIKRRGYRQRVVWGSDMISVPWYGSVRALVRGMEKNAFAGVDYRIGMVLAASLALGLFAIWPFIAVWLLDGPARYLYAFSVLVLLGRAWITAVELRQSCWCVPLVPVAAGMLIYIQWRAMVLLYVNNGIRWRDTHYSLSELKANRV
ncbi:MAG: glycosyltransferase [Planctomycetota bacterium]